MNEILRDYMEDFLLKEDSLKASLYYHLRSRMETFFREYSLRIFPEYYFPELKYRADLAIVRMDADAEPYYLKDKVRDVIAVFELKYVNAEGNVQAVEQWIRKDITKFRRYIQKGKIDAQFYFAVIYEGERHPRQWVDKRRSTNWAKGRLTELNASLDGTDMCFEVYYY